MIPSTWAGVRRPADGELVGYLVPDGGRGVVPTTVLGTPLDRPLPAAAARRLLVDAGLAAIARRWWCRLPEPMPGRLDAARPEATWTWRPVVLVEATPEGCRVRPEWPVPGESGALAALPVPVGDLLREEPPAE